MPTIDFNQFKIDTANRYGVDKNKVRCLYCKYWGYNCGKAMNSVGESWCIIRKKNFQTASYQFCLKYALKEI